MYYVYFVDDKILLGSIQRTELERIVDYQMSHEKKIEFYNQLSIQRRPMPRVTLTESGMDLGDRDTVDGDTQVHYSVSISNFIYFLYNTCCINNIVK